MSTLLQHLYSCNRCSKCMIHKGNDFDFPLAYIRKKAQRLCHKFDIRYRSNEKPGLHLPFTHPSLERVRTYVSLAVKEKVIHPRLIANYDQVWSTNYRPAKRVLQKPGGARGLLRDPLSKSLAMRRIRHNIERCLNMDLTEEDPASTSVEEPSSNGLHQITGGSAGVAPVDEWRLPRTVTTISFVDGHVSRAYVTLPAVWNHARKHSEAHQPAVGQISVHRAAAGYQSYLERGHPNQVPRLPCQGGQNTEEDAGIGCNGKGPGTSRPGWRAYVQKV